MKLTKLVVPVILLSMSKTSFSQTITPDSSTHYKYAHDINSLSPLFKMWAIQAAYNCSPKNEFMLGLAYANIEYKEGRSHAATLIVGYRRFFWKSLHREHQLPEYFRY